MLYCQDIYPLRKAWQWVGGGGDVLSCHNAAVYGIYGIGTTLCVFDGLDSVVVVKLVGRGVDVISTGVVST